MRLPGIVCLTGIDSCGKSTQVEMLADWIDAHRLHKLERGNPPECVEPLTLRHSFPTYSPPVGALIRRFFSPGQLVSSGDADVDGVNQALVLQSLMTLDRLAHADVIEYANVVEGRSVVLSRYWASAVAYGTADGLDPRWVESLHTRLPKAHHVLIDVPVDLSFERRPERRDKYEADHGRLERARAAYLDLFFRKGCPRNAWDAGAPYVSSPSGWSIVGGEVSPSEVFDRVLAALELS